MESVCVVLSGGVDSSVLCGLAGHRLLCCVFVDYGQPSLNNERKSAKAVAAHFGVPLHEVSVGALSIDKLQQAAGAAVVSARNAIILSCAANVAKGVDVLWIGCALSDQRDYFDCSPVFLDAMTTALQVRIEAPLLRLSRRDIESRAQDMGLDGMTWSCYRGGVKPCGECNSCLQ